MTTLQPAIAVLIVARPLYTILAPCSCSKCTRGLGAQARRREGHLLRSLIFLYRSPHAPSGSKAELRALPLGFRSLDCLVAEETALPAAADG